MYKNILLPVDVVEKGSSDRALAAALSFAEAFGSKLHLMTVIPDAGMAIVSQYFSKSAAGDIVEATRKSLHEFSEEKIPEKFQVQHIVKTGNVYESIIVAAKKIDCDLIIMSAHRPDLKDYLLGPNAARVVRHSDRSVLVVRD